MPVMQPDAGPPKPVVMAPVPDPARFPVWGLDVSHYQKRIDWEAVAHSPRFKFAYIKATEGSNWTDTQFQRNWRRARAAGLRVGAYHFFTFCRPGDEQARHFLSVLPRARRMLPPVVDVEFVGNCRSDPDAAAVRKSLGAFLTAVERRLHRRPIIYADDVAQDRFLRGADFHYPLWVPSRGAEPPASGDPWTFWQVDDKAAVPGVPTPVDMDVFGHELAGLDEL
jgi:lysozyme